MFCVGFLCMIISSWPQARPTSDSPGPEITKLVYKWIGVSGGYLGNFSYALHDRFWLDVCDVSVSTAAFAGTTRECFEATLFDASAADQAAALRAILDEYPPVDDRDAQGNFRASRLHAEILRWIERLETGHVAVPMHLASTTDIVRRALDDADVLLKSSGPQSAVDRVHTAFHGYLYALSNEAGVGGLPDRPTMNQLFKAMRGSHPALTNLGPVPKRFQGCCNPWRRFRRPKPSS